MLDVEIKLLDRGLMPEKKTTGAVCYDAFAREDVVIPARKIKIVPLGFCVSIPEGYELQVRPRSGMTAKEGIVTMLGTIDCDYRGEVGAIIYNTTDEDYTVQKDTRCCQLAFRPLGNCDCVRFQSVIELTETDRGSSGFGSTGK